MKIKFLQGWVAYPNGFTRKEFKKGEEVTNLPLDLCMAWVKAGLAEEVGAKPEPIPAKTRAKKPGVKRRSTK